MISWKPIETAPKDGSYVLCWAPGWENPCFLIWKINSRIVSAKQTGKNTWQNIGDMAESYFGDPQEMDDYELAKPGGGPTHWVSLPPFPEVGGLTMEIRNAIIITNEKSELRMTLAEQVNFKVDHRNSA
jgi:hypothetical protein